MAEVDDCVENFILTDERDVKNNHESSDTPVLQPTGEFVNNSYVLKSSGNEIETEPCERKKKTRRGKPKRKNPYNKEGHESRKAVNRSKNRPRFAHRHADAPYNTNEFLMEDHNAFVKLNSPAVAASSTETSRPPRVRDPSFTSVDSDEDHFYSSPEDEEEFLTKEFSNTYQDLHVETLQGMTKSELIQQVLQLEEKVDGLEKRLGYRTKYDKDQPDKLKTTVEVFPEDGEKASVDKIKQYQIEISRLHVENEKLQIENERLRRRNRSSSVSSVDSESDSTTSSPSSVSDLSDKEDLIETNVNEEMDDSRGKCVVSEESNNTDVAIEERDMKE